jgi:adenylate cyclase, class 2
MHEVEAKVHISKGDFLRLKKELDKTAVFKGETIKNDIYYCEDAYIRTRETGNELILNIKNKVIEKGIESNAEIEWKITDKKEFENFLNIINIKPYLKKIKTTRAYQFKSFNIELNYVKNLGYFLEIERVIQSKSQISKTKKELIDIFKKFGFKQNQFEKRFYADLLQKN